MARFYFDFLGVTIANGEYHTTPFDIIKNDGFLYVENFNDNGKTEGIIDIENIKPYGLNLIDWRNGNYDVIFNSINPPSTSPKTILKKTYYSSDTISATLYNNGQTHAYIRSHDCFFDDIIPLISNSNITMTECQDGIIIVITGEYQCKNYLMILLYNGEFIKLYDGLSDNIEFSKSGFRTKEKLKDMLGRTKITNYSFKNTTLKQEVSFEYGKDSSALIPYQFLEALMYNDAKKLASYLSDEIKAPIESFNEFFGTFDEVAFPKYKKCEKISDLNEVATINHKNTGLIKPSFYTFEIKDGLITNIIS